jgi:hypothetical protein
MGMIGLYKHVSRETLESFKARPDLIEVFFYCNPSEEPASDPVIRLIAANDKFMEMKSARPGLVRSLYGRHKNSPEALALEKEFLECLKEWGSPAFSLYKDWLELHELLNGANEPTKTPLGQAIMGYGPTPFLDPDSVRLSSQALGGISEADFWKLAKENAVCWTAGKTDEEKGNDEVEYLWQLMKGFTDYYKEAAAAGHAMVFCRD